MCNYDFDSVIDVWFQAKNVGKLLPDTLIGVAHPQL